ncbi:MAG: KOW motif-containing protein [Candidatus Woesearchaeota archaeon]
MFEKGRVVMKIAGRDSGKLGVILEIEENFALVDGFLRNKKVNIKHLEPLKKTIDVSNIGSDGIREELKKIN